MQTSHEQVSPLQSGHAQPSQALDAAVDSNVAVQALGMAEPRTDWAQQAAVFVTGTTPAAIVQPQLPHSQTAQLQTPPLQFGQRQSTQQQPDELFIEVTPDPAQANAQANPIDNVARTAETENRVMIFSQTNGITWKRKSRSHSIVSFQPFAQECQ